jgi:hypothetical protein
LLALSGLNYSVSVITNKKMNNHDVTSFYSNITFGNIGNARSKETGFDGFRSRIRSERFLV